MKLSTEQARDYVESYFNGECATRTCTVDRHGFTIAVTGRDRNGIKEYIADVFHAALDSECDA